MTQNSMQRKPYPLGAHCEGKGIRFSFVSTKENCGILIYDRKTGRELERVPFDSDCKIGNIYCKYVTKYQASDILYHFYEEDRLVVDERARFFAGKNSYGTERLPEEWKAGFVTQGFDWQGDVKPRIPYEDCIGYLLHVRGFTKHASSKVKASNRGTFRGVMEKLPYLCDMGITTVELQPAYEFYECAPLEERTKDIPYFVNMGDVISEPKLNYWGYRKGCYYAPKAAYAAGDATVEFKELVRAFHKQGMEVVMQFYFPKEVSVLEIPEILRYWVMEYHVDGFHLMGENLPADMLAADPALSDTKLWYYGFHTEHLYQRDESPAYCNLASYQDDYLYVMRKFLKGDEDMVKSVMHHMHHIPEKMGRIHYMSNYYGLTLMDMVSYERKHNEDNGEEDRDGNDYNCSWNCGEEGSTRKKKISELRKKQLKNAMCMLFFSQSTPLLFMGDEFGNSQKGNNNPYCQDNSVTWLDWRDMERNAQLHSFCKQLIMLRKSHPVLHQAKEPKIMDYIACGYPDLSYHGLNAWRPQTENYSRCIAMMYCGKYAKVNHTRDDDFFYIAMNMHWESHAFGLPRLPKGMKWQLLLSTDEAVIAKEAEEASSEAVETKTEGSAEVRNVVPARSIMIFTSVPDENFREETGRKSRGKRSGAVEYKDRTSF